MCPGRALALRAQVLRALAGRPLETKQQLRVVLLDDAAEGQLRHIADAAVEEVVVAAVGHLACLRPDSGGSTFKA